MALLAYLVGRLFFYAEESFVHILFRLLNKLFLEETFFKSKAL